MQRPFVTLFLLAVAVLCRDSTSEQVAAQTQPEIESQAVTQAAAPETSKEISRLDVGDQAPNFRLKDQHGTERTLEGLLAEGGVALVFHRSADW